MMVIILMAGSGFSIMPVNVFKTITIGSLKLCIGVRRGFCVCNDRQLSVGGMDHFLPQDHGVCNGAVLNVTLTIKYGNGPMPCTDASVQTRAPRLNVGDQDTIQYDISKLPSDARVLDQHSISEPRPLLAYPLLEKRLDLPYNAKYGYVQLAKHPVTTEVSEHFRALVERVQLGLIAGHSPQLALEGSGGVYFMKDESGTCNLAVFKPIDEEPMAVNNPRGFSSSYAGEEGLKKGTRIGEGAVREVAAYILDHPVAGHRCEVIRKDEEGFAGVPPSAMVRCYHEAFAYTRGKCQSFKEAKLGSLQQFVAAFASCEEMGVSFFPVEEVHKITVLDLRLANTDRHAGNILVCREKDGVLKLVPIDHGYCLPEEFGECTFEWLYWPQASKPYGSSALKYIEALDAEQDIELLRQCGWNLRPSCARVLRVATMLLKKGAAAGLTPFQIGSIMSCSKSMDDKPPVEALLEQAEAMRRCSTLESDILMSFANLLDDYIDKVAREGMYVS